MGIYGPDHRIYLITGFTFSSTKWELLPIPDVVIDRISKFDETMKMERMRTDELPSPLVDLRHKENNDNGDILRDDDDHDMHGPNRIIVNELTITPILPTDEDDGNDDDNHVIQINDKTNTMGANEIDENNDVNGMGTIYIDGLRRSASVNPILECDNISFKKACQ